MSVRKHLAWVGLSQTFYFIAQLGSSLVVARLLSPYELGVFAVGLAIVGIVSAIQNFGLNSFIVREQNLSPRLEQTTFTINSILASVLVLIIVIASRLSAGFFHEGGIRNVLTVLAILPAIGAFSFLPESKLERQARFGTLSTLTAVRTFISQGTTIILAYNHFSYLSLAYGQLAGSLVGVVAINIYAREHVSFRLSLQDWRIVHRYGLRVFLTSGTVSITERLSNFIIGRVVGLSPLGIYSRASNLNNLVWENLHLIAGRVLFVNLAETKRSGHSISDSYIRITDLNTVLLWPAFLGLSIISGPLIRLVYGQQWVAAAKPLCFMALAGMVYVSRSMTWEIYVLGDRVGKQLRIELLRMFLSIILVLASSFFGLVFIAASGMVMSVVSNQLYQKDVDEITETEFSDFKVIYLRNAALAIVAVLPAAIIMLRFQASEYAPVYLVLLSIALGAVFWLGGLFACRHPLSGEIKYLLRKTQRPLRR